MSETEMNFGPDWLRALSDSGTNKNSNQTSNNLNNSQNNSSANNASFKYKLAEYRYGREEMLALFDKKVKMQPKLKEFTGLVTNKCQIPLSLIPMTEEEQRIWSKSLNSDIVMRLANKSSINAQIGPNSPNAINGGLPTSANERNSGNLERGSSLESRGLNATGLRANLNDRGRGRPPRTFMRNSSYEDETGNETGNYPSTGGDNLRREYRSKSNFDRSNQDDPAGSNPRENKPTFERQFSKPPPIGNENSDQDNANSTGNRLNFRSKPQSSSLDSQQNDSSWRSNRPNVRNDNSRRNLDWRNKYRSDETNNSTGNQSSDWKRSNDRWRNDNDQDDNELDRRRFNFNNKSSLNNKDKSAWDDHDDDKRNLPEWSLDDDAVLDRKFGTFDASGQFREDPIVESFSNNIKDNQLSATSRTTDDWFIGKDKLDTNITHKLMNNKDEKTSSFPTTSHSNNDHLVSSMLNKSKSIIDDKNIKFTQSLFDDLMGKTASSSVIQTQMSKKPTLKSDLDSTDLEVERQKYTQNFISSLIQRQSNQQNDILAQRQQRKQANEKDVANTNQESFFDNFNLNSMNINQSNYAQQLSHHFNKNQPEQEANARLFENLLDAKNKLQQQQKLSSSQIDSTNDDKLSKLTLGESSKNDVQNLLESIANKQQQQHNYALNPDLQKMMFSLAETEKLLKEINKSNNNPTVKQQVTPTSLSTQAQQSFKNIYPNDEHHFNERTADNMVNQWTTTTTTAQHNQQQQQQHQSHNEQDELSLKERHKSTVFPPNHEYGQLWFYQDPQKAVQGPFSSNDMLDWYKCGYFTMDLLVRRECDEVFSKLGELIETWKRIPFLPGDNPAPLLKNTQQPPQPQQQPQPHQEINVTPPQLNPAAAINLSMVVQPGLQIPNQAALFQMISPPTPDFNNAMRTTTAAAAAANQQIPMPIVLNQQQLHDQQKTMFLRQMQMQHQQFMMDPVMQAQFRQLFSQLTPNQPAPQQPPQQQQQQQAPSLTNVIPPNEDAQQQLMNSAASNSMNMNPMIKQILATKSGQPNMWNLNGEQVMTVTAIEEMQRQEQDRREIEEKQRKLIEQEQERRKLEEMQLMKLEEERKRLKKLEEQKKLREEERLIMLDNKRKEKELEQEMIKKQLSRQKQLEQEQNQKQQQQQQQLIEQAKQRQQQLISEASYQQQNTHTSSIASHSQQQQIIQSKSATSQPQKKKSWAVISTDQPTSLDEIQKLQETTEREERLKQTQQMLQMIQDNQKSKGWSNVMGKMSTTQPIKTLDEIQREESERLARLKKLEEENQVNQLPTQNVGVWGNAANNLQWKAASPLNIWGQSNQSNSNQDFSNDSQSAANEPSPWSIESNVNAATANGLPAISSKNFQNTTKSTVNSEQTKHQEPSAFQLSSTINNGGPNGQQPANKKTKPKTGKEEQISNSSSLTNSTTSTISSNKKSNQKMPTDEFSKWCIEALSQFKETIDIPTFISFLKDVESPHDVNDYVFSYLGESKDSKEFSKRFIEKRSFYKNQAKKTSKKEIEDAGIWGPAPAILPQSVTKGAKVEESEFSIFKSGKRKKKSGKKSDE